MKLPTSRDHSHRRAMARVRFGVGVWLLALAAFLSYSGFWWGVLLIASAALHLYFGCRLQRSRPEGTASALRRPGSRR
jgi:phosphatidylglycerophosphate synthase